MNWLNYHHLYYFYQIAEKGSVSEAAKSLLVGQPAVSAQLKELEQRLGVLFERRSRGLILTERGKLVLKYAKDIFTKGDELIYVLERGQHALERQLILGAQIGVPKAITAQTIRRLQRKTNLKIRIVEGEAPVLVDELLSGKIEMALVDHHIYHSIENLVYLSIGQEMICFWGADSFKGLKQGFPSSLDQVPMVLSCVGHPLRQEVEKFFLEQNLNLNIVVEAPDTALIKELGRDGAGVIALGESTTKAWAQAGGLYRLGSLDYVQQYSLAIRKRFLKDPIYDLIAKEFKKSPEIARK